MANNRTADNAVLLAQERVSAWWPKFLQQWQGGYANVLPAIALRMTPPDVQAQLKQQNPQAYDSVMKRFGGNQNAQ